MTTREIKVDAQQRAARTLVQGLVFDIAAGLTLLGLTIFSKANAWGRSGVVARNVFGG